ncbi:MAG TPA: Uma2 family endonuclease [Blastocatellia bacterium]|nr:Uma2 family endonuclease [Blastocatellia bacterium]
MSLRRSVDRHSVAAYLATERQSQERHEYLDGEIFVIAGESPDHGSICSNISGQLYVQLRGTPCRVFSKDTKVRSGPAPFQPGKSEGLYSYPDVLVVCGDLEFHDEHRDVILNPTVVIEVLSPATEAFDRGEKWTRYQAYLPDLTDYLLVSQSKPQVEHFQRQDSGEWLYSRTHGLDGTVRLASIDCALKLDDIYERIVFPD